VCKKIAICVCMLSLLTIYPALGAEPVENDTGSGGLKGAKQLTPVLDLAGNELKRVGIKLMDNAIYSMQQLWQDTINLNFK
jgi:hypothetical protein